MIFLFIKNEPTFLLVAIYDPIFFLIEVLFSMFPLPEKKSWVFLAILKWSEGGWTES